jgi:hypothetical protein
MERLWETWRGRLPQELRLARITTWKAANGFLEHTWVPFHNRTWTVAAAQEGTAFVPYIGGQLDRIFPLHHERIVGNDNCVEFRNRRLRCFLGRRFRLGSIPASRRILQTVSRPMTIPSCSQSSSQKC